MNASSAPGIRELAEKGSRIYAEKVQQGVLDEGALKGKVVAIEVESGSHFVGSSVMDAYDKARVEYPNSFFHFVHVGEATAHSMSKRVAAYGWPL